ncbi:MAG TPA: DUF1993 domain-containing protein [Rhodanobacteraceae bacterium]|nr:DUF1993 domain-containing protein [Rhodanobacteraceae bacterium]
MTLSMYQASVPVFTRALRNLTHVLKQGEALAQAKNFAPEVLLQTRLIADMLPLVKQVQIACDMAARGAARLAGAEPKSFEDNEASFAELYDRLDRAIAYIESFGPEQIDGSETRPIHLKMRSGDRNFEGRDYLLQFTLPNMFFHCTTAYDILRQAGTPIGKLDFIGQS